MKKYFTHLSLITILAIAIIGCMGEDGADGQDGRDGLDGDSYITYSWLFGPFTYTTSDPGIPSIIFSGNYYPTQSGTWNYAYEAWDGSVWYGNYTIYIDEGEPGQSGESGESGDLFWKDGEDGADGENGEDGADICFELACFSSGPSFYAWSCAWGRTTVFDQGFQDELEKYENSEIVLEKSSNSQVFDELLDFDLEIKDPSIKLQEGVKGIYRYRHLFKQIN